jgi:hypothetical protein
MTYKIPSCSLLLRGEPQIWTKLTIYDINTLNKFGLKYCWSVLLLNHVIENFSLSSVNLSKPTDYVMHHQQFNIRQLYALPTLYLCVLYLSENKQQLVPLTA